METALPEVPEPTARLAFRRWRESDAPVLLDMYSRREVYRFLGSVPRPVHDLDEALARIEGFTARTHGLAGIWAIVRAEDDVVIGTVLLVPLPRTDGQPSDVHEIGWHLHPDAWGSGYATEAAGSVIARARAGGLAEVRAVVYPDNAASHAVCRRLGMTQLGLTGEWYNVEVVEYRLAPERPRGDRDGAVSRRLARPPGSCASPPSPTARRRSPRTWPSSVPMMSPPGERAWPRDSWAVAHRDGASVGVLAVSDPAPRDTADGWVHSWWIAPGARGRELHARCWRGSWSWGALESGRESHWESGRRTRARSPPSRRSDSSGRSRGRLAPWRAALRGDGPGPH